MDYFKSITINSQKVVDKFWRNVLKKDPALCWEWLGPVNKDGYGELHYTELHRCQRSVLAHRFSLALKDGFIDSRKCACHTCDNPICVNPNHLFAGTRNDNNQDMHRKKRQAVGRKLPHAKLSEEIVAIARKRRDRGELYSEIAKDYGVCLSTMRKAILGRVTWMHVTP